MGLLLTTVSMGEPVAKGGAADGLESPKQARHLPSRSVAANARFEPPPLDERPGHLAWAFTVAGDASPAMS